jgi:hypothetical protein
MKKNKKTILLLLTFICIINSFGQKSKIMKTQPQKIKALDIKPSATSSEKDFDFLEGKWKVQNRMLKARLENNNEWSEFESELHLRKTIRNGCTIIQSKN